MTIKPTVDLGYPTEPHGKMPAFNSIEEEAGFWDTHDVTDYLDDMEPIQIEVTGGLAERLTVRIDEDDRTHLVRLARKKGLGPSTLARMWLKERLQDESAKEAKAG